MTEKLLRMKQVLEIIPLSRSEIWRKVKNHDFPAPVKLSPAVTVWHSTDIQKFIDQYKQDNNSASMLE